MRILAICGSLQEKSSNLTLLRVAIASAPAGVEIQLYEGLRHLPHFNPDLASDAPENEPRAVAELRRCGGQRGRALDRDARVRS